jgi:hypothetical protein
MLNFTSNEVQNFLNSENALFHYTKLNIGIEKILPNSKLLINRITNFSDFREKIFSGTTFIYSDKRELDKQRSNDILKKYNELIKHYRVISFCSNDQKIDDSMGNVYVNIFDKYNIKNPFRVLEGYKKDRMWDMYGDNYRGICFVFDKKNLIKKIKSQFQNFKDDYVKYTLNPDRHYHEIDLREEDINKETKKTIISKIFVKHYDYKDENEYRIAVYDDSAYDIYVDISNSLFGIILGPDFVDIYLPLVKELLKKVQNNIYLFKYEIGTDAWDKLYLLNG